MDAESNIWAGDLWLGAALGALVSVASGTGEPAESARHWLTVVPSEVKRVWPGTFPEFPYDGEPEDERLLRLQAENAELRADAARERSIWLGE